MSPIQHSETQTETFQTNASDRHGKYIRLEATNDNKSLHTSHFLRRCALLRLREQLEARGLKSWVR